MPASDPSRAARGVILRMTGAMKPPAISTKLCTNTQVRPASQRLHRIVGLGQDRQHDDEGDDEHVRHADARGQRADVGAAGLLRQPVGRARRNTPCSGTASGRCAGRMRPNTSASGIFSTKRSSAGQHEHVDQDVGAEAEEGVPVARNPERSSGFGVAVMLIAPLLSLLQLAHRQASAADQVAGIGRPSRRCRPGP